MEHKQDIFEGHSLSDYEKNIAGHAIEKAPVITKAYVRPDGTTVKVQFFRNQFGGYYLSTEDSFGHGQRLQGHLESDSNTVEEYMEIWSKGLRYREINK